MNQRSPSSLSVFAHGDGRDVAIEAASTKWLRCLLLERPVKSKTRRGPASRTTMIRKLDPSATSLPEVCEALHQTGESRREQKALDIFSPNPGDSEVSASSSGLNSTKRKLHPRSIWIAVNGSDLSARQFMVRSKMDGSGSHVDAESSAHTTRHGSRKAEKLIAWPTYPQAPQPERI